MSDKPQASLVAKKVLKLMCRCLNYNRKIEHDICTCTSDDEHRRLGCHSVDGFLESTIEEINLLWNDDGQNDQEEKCEFCGFDKD